MEIPVIHEVSSTSNSTPRCSATETNASSKYTVNPASSSASNRYVQVSKSSSLSQQSPPSQVHEKIKCTMHKEEVIIAPKPRTPVKSAAVKKAEEAISLKSTQQSLHTRLPSTDSGIQADGGFDSLSRYRGKTFLSASSNAAGDSSNIDTDIGNTVNVHSSRSGSSSGYSSDQSTLSNPPPSSLASRVVAIPSQSFVANSKPVSSVRSSPTSRSTSSSSGSTSQSGVSVTSRTSSSTSQSREIHNAKPTLPSKPLSLYPTSVSSSSNVTSNMSKKPAVYANTASANQSSDNTRLSGTHKSELSTSVANRKAGHTVSVTNPNSSSDSTYVKMSPSVKIVTNDSGVKLSFSKNSVSISSNSSVSSRANSSSSSTTVNSVPVSASTRKDNPNISNPSSKASTSTTLFSAPGSTLKLQVISANRPGLGQTQGQQDVSKSQGQGCIALTRPLRLGTPSKVTVRPVQATALNSQPPNVAPVVRQSQPPGQPQPLQQQHQQQQQQQEQQRQQPVSSPAKVKPKIAPRPSVATKTVTTQAANAHVSTIVTSSPVPLSKSFVNSTPITSSISSTKKPSTTNSQPEAGTFRKTDVSSVHSAKTTNVQTGRTEIPVTHVVNRTPSYKTPPSHTPYCRPSSFAGGSSRLTPDRERLGQSHQQSYKQPIYENVNVRFDIKDGFSFDDHDTKMKHAELILKQSDELINDALKMLSSSPVSSNDAKYNGFTNSHGKFPEEERIVEGADSTSEKEHTVPIFDVKTGKFHSGGKTSHWNDVKGTSSEGKAEVSWKERKERMDSALSWLKHELAGLRDMDNTLISQFKRCQDTIETLKTQRDVWEGLSEEGEDVDYWDDFELNEFNRRYLDSPGGSSSSQFSPGSRDPSLQDVTTISLPVPQLQLPQDRKGANYHNGHGSHVKQDVEATL